MAQLQDIVAGSRALRVLGTGHSFNPIADTPGDLVRLARLPRRLVVDPDLRVAALDGAWRYGELARTLHATGWALPNLGSLPHIDVAGSCATGTHGSGTGNAILAGAVRALTLVTASGDLVSLETGDPDFPGAVVALGAVGVVVRLTLAVQPTYAVAQRVYEDLPFAAAVDQLDRILEAAYSVSLFSRWRTAVFDQVWVKKRTDQTGDADGLLRQLGARPATQPRHPAPGMSPANCTEQLGVPAPWHERLPHFRLGYVPSSGAELQSEYLVDRADAAGALTALAEIREHIAPALLVGEVRAVAGDDLWLSPCSGRSTVGFHFTWRPDIRAVGPVVEAVEAALAPFAARPHWAKLTRQAPRDTVALYPRWSDFLAMQGRYDPRGTFRNPWLAAYLAAG